MDVDRKEHSRNASGLAGYQAAGFPLAPRATEIAWQTTVVSGTQDGGKFSREGTAVFGSGEKAGMTCEGTEGPPDGKGRPTVAVGSVLRFRDGSSIALRSAGFRDPKTLDVGGSGEFVGGTGRYEGIAGTFTYTGIAGKAESVGTYTLRK
jgi:hypothetical protein